MTVHTRSFPQGFPTGKKSTPHIIDLTDIRKLSSQLCSLAMFCPFKVIEGPGVQFRNDGQGNLSYCNFQRISFTCRSVRWGMWEYTTPEEASELICGVCCFASALRTQAGLCPEPTRSLSFPTDPRRKKEELSEALTQPHNQLNQGGGGFILGRVRVQKMVPFHYQSDDDTYDVCEKPT
jgi:hypothetical protein